jgi:hypothetical protein
VKIREEGLAVATVLAGDDGHIEAGVVLAGSPTARYCMGVGGEKQPASAGRRSAWLSTPIWPARRALVVPRRGLHVIDRRVGLHS